MKLFTVKKLHNELFHYLFTIFKFKNYNSLMTVYANAKDRANARFYLIADTDIEITDYCLERGYEIINRPNYVEPGMVCHHFEWVGVRARPAIWEISRPYPKN